MKPKIGWLGRLIPGLVEDIETVRRQMSDQRRRLADLSKQREQTQELLESLDNAVRIREDDWWMMGGEESAEKEQ